MASSSRARRRYRTDQRGQVYGQAMRRHRAPFRALDTFFAVRSWVVCTTSMSGFDLRQTHPDDPEQVLEGAYLLVLGHQGAIGEKVCALKPRSTTLLAALRNRTLMS